MDDDQKCKNLLCERTCEHCKNEEEDFKTINIKKFPVKIPKMHKPLLVEKKLNNIITSITVFIKDNSLLIKAEDWNKNSTYIIHFRYPKCILTNRIIPEEMTCDQFISTK